MPWWGWLLITLGSIASLYTLVAIILFTILGINFWKSWKDLF